MRGEQSGEQMQVQFHRDFFSLHILNLSECHKFERKFKVSETMQHTLSNKGRISCCVTTLYVRQVQSRVVTEKTRLKTF